LWHTLYAGKREIINGFAENYNYLKEKGIKFPPNKDSKYSSLRAFSFPFPCKLTLNRKRRERGEQRATLGKQV
jgi:hypothetical protein